MGLFCTPSSLNSLVEKLSINYWNNYMYFSEVKIWISRGGGMGSAEKQQAICNDQFTR